MATPVHLDWNGDDLDDLLSLSVDRTDPAAPQFAGAVFLAGASR